MTRCYFFVFLSCFCTAFYAQETVFPGDANANNIVDQYDLLSIGYAFGTTGPARIQTEDVSLQGIPLFWDETFPQGTNFIHTDCDGNGVVDYLDFVALNNNFGYPLENPSPLEIEAGVLGLDTAIVWNNNVFEVTASSGTILNIPVSIPLSDQQAVNGLAFKLRYEPQYFELAGFSSEQQWLRTDDEAMSMVKVNNEDAGLMGVATSRFGVDPVFGGGNGGVLSIIIIEDMVDYLEAPDDTIRTKIYLEDILMVDENFNPIPIASDTFILKLYHDITSSVDDKRQTNALEAAIFPNPSSGLFHLNSQHSFNTIEWMDAYGKQGIFYEGEPRKRWSTENLFIPSGMYTIRLSGEAGISILKYIHLTEP